ncbi:MAG TPA: ATP-binding cassette domain-containing protein [Solirubrobacteraceae bacterium]|jgi:ABC-2 type transport system ATP-binding protein|nr:ATP-binding cassette domain-containing protein [Solirubrobacteraceae bacterium]
MIEANSLTKRYGARTAARDVSFRCEPGTVTGFLGPNGAGKSTTLKMLCGMAQPTSGHSTLLGRPFAEIPNPGRRIGVLIDASAQHSGRRGAEVLATSAQLMGVDQRRVGEMLELVGLDGAAGRKRVGKYSLGMRQRLGIAHALLGDPEVLILDEPANGLDPEGMRWMRALLRDFADRGGTVLLSSHLLGEVQATADRLVVIARGEIVAQGSPGELTGGGARTIVRTADGAASDRALRRALAAEEIIAREAPDGGLLTEADPEVVGRAALRGGVALTELRPATDGASLEQLFFELTTDKTEYHAELPELQEIAR